MKGSWNNELGNWIALQRHPPRTPFHFQLDRYPRLRQSLHTNVIAFLAVIRELAHLMFFRQPYPLLLNNNHRIHRRRSMNSLQLRLQLDHSLRFNNFWGTAESPKRESQNISDLSHMTLIHNRPYVHSPVRAINFDQQQVVVAQHSLTFLFLAIHYFLLVILRTRCLNVINFTPIASGSSPTAGLAWHLTKSC